MENNEGPARRRCLLPTVMLALLPVFYLASVGPLYWLNDRGVLSDTAWDAICQTVYLPLACLESDTSFFESPVGKAYWWYLELFAD